MLATNYYLYAADTERRYKSRRLTVTGLIPCDEIGGDEICRRQPPQPSVRGGFQRQWGAVVVDADKPFDTPCRGYYVAQHFP